MSCFYQSNDYHQNKESILQCPITPIRKRNYEDYLSASALLDLSNISKTDLLSEANLLIKLKRKKMFLTTDIKQIKQIKHERLIMIKHALNCKTISCPIKSCKDCKQLIKHIKNCDNVNCQTPFCCTTRLFINQNFQDMSNKDN